MSSTASRKVAVAALAGATIVASIGAPAVSARPIDQVIPGTASGASLPSAPPPPSSIAVSARGAYQDLRSPDTRDQAEGYHPTLKLQPVAGTPPPSGGFDLLSAAIGGAAGTGLVIVLAGAGIVRRRPPTRRHGAARA